MAYLTRKRIKGITYYYAEESEWKNGRSKRIWQKYLGPVSKIIAAMETTPKRPKYAEIFQFGGPAAYLNIIEEFNMKEIIDGFFPKRGQGLSIGFYLTLAAVNRGIEAVSKRSMWKWFQNTILLRMFSEVDKPSLSSQRFWDNMSAIEEDKITLVWMKLVNSILDHENIDLSCASFDETNFYSFIGSFNMRCSLAKRGKNKQGRRDLRQINYALFCTRNDHFPLYFDVFEGNRHDSKEFGVVIDLKSSESLLKNSFGLLNTENPIVQA
jgi:transposase